MKPEIKHTTPGLQGKEYSGSFVLMNLRPYCINTTDPWSYFGILLFEFKVLVKCHGHVEMVSLWGRLRLGSTLCIYFRGTEEERPSFKENRDNIGELGM